MAEYVALKTFLGKYGQMHRGMVYTLPDGYASDLARNGLVRRKSIDSAPQNAAMPEAPVQLGEDTVARPDDGKGPQPFVLHQAPRSRRRIVGTLNRGPK